MATDNLNRSQCNFKEWMKLQADDLAELRQALEQKSQDEQHLTQLAQNTITHFEDYIQRRNQLAEGEVSAFLAPVWCASIELPLLWLGGCRPSSFMRLIYAESGSELQTSMEEFLAGNVTNSDELGGVSGKQLLLIDDLRRKTIREEEKLSRQLASLQEDTADQPLSTLSSRSSQIGMITDEVTKALDKHEVALLSLMKEADKLRLKTLKEIIDILTPLQTVRYLIASKKFHLTMHEWGKRRARGQASHGEP